MKIKVKNIIQSRESLLKLFNSEKLRAITAFNLSKIINDIDEIYNRYENIRTKKILKYGMQDSNNKIIVKPEFEEKFKNEILEILEEEIEIIFSKIKLSEIPDGILNSIDFLNLNFLIINDVGEKINES